MTRLAMALAMVGIACLPFGLSLNGVNALRASAAESELLGDSAGGSISASTLGAIDASTIEDGLKLVEVGVLRPSFYWVTEESNDGAKRDTKVLDVNGNVMATVSAAFYKTLEMEGTGRLLDGRVLNFKTRKVNADGSLTIFWRVCGADAPDGYGVDDRPLIAFRSVAVDPKVIPIGSRVYIPAAKGAPLPDGTKHDGYFLAVDIGDLIQSKKIDIFTGFGDQEKLFEKVGMETGKMVQVFMVK